ncbi:GNAT family N-acetyltransferase [Streptomyces sp. NPDC002055]|uniref:GNAT family N-acetyltransferase n=1 Tax=Streptomyces sp. NPDC002055 TaxID=3154534 RepID=UPI003320B8F2
MTTADVALRHYTHDDLAQIRQTLLDVHADAYAARAEEEFVQRFPWFVDHWGNKAGFSCVIAHDGGGQPIGFTYGAPSEAGQEWWREYVPTLPAETSTFAISELMLRVAWRGRGLGQYLHRALLGPRNEALAALTVDTKRPRLQALYESWGYRKVGVRQPFPDSPVYAVMVLDLTVEI